jgi:hypothetical protein
MGCAPRAGNAADSRLVRDRHRDRRLDDRGGELERHLLGLAVGCIFRLDRNS